MSSLTENVSAAEPERDLSQEPETDQPEPTEPELEEADLRAEATSLLAAGEWREALEVLQTVTDEALDDCEAWTMVARAFRGLGDRKRCYWAAVMTVRADPYSSPGYEWKVRGHLAYGETDEALTAAREGVEMTHGEPGARRFLIAALLRKQHTLEAEAELARLYPDLPEDPELIALNGEVLRLRGQDEPAVGWFQSALFRDIDCEWAYAGLAGLHAHRGRHPEAAEAYYHAARCSPMDWVYRGSFLDQVDGLIQDTGWGRVAHICRVAFEGACRAHLGCMFFMLPLAALGSFIAPRVHRMIARSVLKRHPAHLGEYYWKALAGHQEEAIPDFPELWLWALGIVGLLVLAQAWGHNQLENGIRICLVGGLLALWGWRRRVGREVPDHFQGLFYFPADERPEGKEPPPPADADPDDFAWWQLCSGKSRRARILARQILAADPENVPALITFSLSCLALGEVEEGRIAAFSALELEPDEPRSVGLAWYLLAAEGRSGEAVDAADGAGEMAADAGMRIYRYARMLRRAGLPEVARVGEQLVREVAPETAEAHALAGAQALAEGRREEAEAFYRQALAREPESADFLTDLGRAVAANRRLPEAWGIWNQALRADPNRPAALEIMKTYLRRGVLVASAGITAVLAGLAFLPTAHGDLSNWWMLLAMVALPPLVWALVVPIRQLVVRRAAPFLRESEDLGLRSVTAAAMKACLPTLFTVQAIQAWLEIALHPVLFQWRWAGAATVTFLALYTVGWALPTLKAEAARTVET